MNKSLLVLVLMIFSFSAYSHFSGSILTQDDFLLAEEDNTFGPALSSAPNEEIQWNSFNQWMCFPMATVNFSCAEYDGIILVPSIRAQTEEQVFHFDTPAEDRIPCEKTLLDWKNISSESPEVCVFAAPMPETDLEEESGRPQSLWYIHTLKAANGYWPARSALQEK